MILEPTIVPYGSFTLSSKSSVRTLSDGFYKTEIAPPEGKTMVSYTVAYSYDDSILWSFDVLKVGYSDILREIHRIADEEPGWLTFVGSEKLLDFIKQETPQCIPWILFHLDEISL